ncbi:Uma2 family endonuclease [Baaleninema simplex]|uniref:Uma2 family endonuclease n=1 Tax=Baaleninema simplex TaxID=2862350 RepID=UPI001FE21953|nr:Uma2 family endonuclease [Baaleninema simplex]
MYRSGVDESESGVTGVGVTEIAVSGKLSVPYNRDGDKDAIETAMSRKIGEFEVEEFLSAPIPTLVLSNIRWTTYRSLLSDLGDRRSIRLTFDRGRLQLKMPSKLHELINRLLARIVTTLTEEFDLEVVNLGSLTLEREDLQRAAEPDTCFYIQNARFLEGLDPEIPTNLPPDLAIEVDITSPSTQRMGVYAALGIAEVWRYTKRDRLKIYCLSPESNGYMESPSSLAFPMVSAEVLNGLLRERETKSENQVIRSLRNWIRDRSIDSIN